MFRDKSSGFRSSSRSAEPGATGDADMLLEKKSNRAEALASPSCDMIVAGAPPTGAGAAGESVYRRTLSKNEILRFLPERNRLARWLRSRSTSFLMWFPTKIGPIVYRYSNTCALCKVLFRERSAYKCGDRLEFQINGLNL